MVDTDIAFQAQQQGPQLPIIAELATGHEPRRISIPTISPSQERSHLGKSSPSRRKVVALIIERTRRAPSAAEMAARRKIRSN